MIWEVAESDITSKSSHVNMKEKQEYFCGLTGLTEKLDGSTDNSLLAFSLLIPKWNDTAAC